MKQIGYKSLRIMSRRCFWCAGTGRRDAEFFIVSPVCHNSFSPDVETHTVCGYCGAFDPLRLEFVVQ